MTSQERKELKVTLSSRVMSSVTEFTKAKDLVSKGEHQQQRRCSECGKSYLGQANSSTCGDKCRQRKSRG